MSLHDAVADDSCSDLIKKTPRRLIYLPSKKFSPDESKHAPNGLISNARGAFN
jgi:hypothetical protein